MYNSLIVFKNLGSMFMCAPICIQQLFYELESYMSW